MSEPPRRNRRRRAMASALRWTVGQELRSGVTADTAMLEGRLRAILEAQLGAPAPLDSDPPELLARLAPAGSLPPEAVLLLATLLPPLLHLPPIAPRSTPR